MSYFDDPANDATAYETEMQERYAPMATMSDAHREWHLNSGVPMGQPGCPQDACHPVDDEDYDMSQIDHLWKYDDEQSWHEAQPEYRAIYGFDDGIPF